MGILQEYKFFLIIAIIALVSIIALFFNTQKSQEYVDFTTNLQASFAQVKGVASDTKTVQAIATVDGTNVKWLKNNSLFGLTLESTANDIEFADLYVKGTGLTAEPAVSAGKFKVTLATTTDGDADTAQTVTAVSGLVTTGSSASAGWDLDSNGYILYTFEDANTAKDIIDQYIPEGTLVGTKTVEVKFIR